MKSYGIEIADTPELTKAYIREVVWDYLEDNDVAEFPRPVHGRIPNFKGAREAGQHVSTLPCFTSANTVKVNPDKPQEIVRFLALKARKTLLVPTPRLCDNSILNRVLCSGEETTSILKFLSKRDGFTKMSLPVMLEDKVKVDLIVIGSVAVSRSGRRIGKGEGFADLEYAMMKSMGAVDDDTIIVTTVHDCQVFDDIPERIFKIHDVPIDYILTPTEVFEVKHSIPKPQGIYWNLLTEKKFHRIPILATLYKRESTESSNMVPPGFDPPSPKTVRHRNFFRRGRGAKVRSTSERGRRRAGLRRKSERNESDSDAIENDHEELTLPQKKIHVTINVSKKNRIIHRTIETAMDSDREGDGHENEKPESRSQMKPYTFGIFVGKLPACQVEELCHAVSLRGVEPTCIDWKGRFGFAFLRFSSPEEECEGILKKLEGLTIQDKEVVIEKAKSFTEKMRRRGRTLSEGSGGMHRIRPRKRYMSDRSKRGPRRISETAEKKVETAENGADEKNEPAINNAVDVASEKENRDGTHVTTYEDSTLQPANRVPEDDRSCTLALQGEIVKESCKDEVGAVGDETGTVHEGKGGSEVAEGSPDVEETKEESPLMQGVKECTPEKPYVPEVTSVAESDIGGPGSSCIATSQEETVASASQ